jgi:hypothetical protein
MFRCSTCDDKIVIPPIDPPHGPLRKWPSYSNLVELAEAGCDICMLVRQHLTTHLSEQSLRSEEGEIRLYGDGHDVSIECAAFHGAFGMRLRNALEKTRKAPSYDRSKVIPKAERWLTTCKSRHRSCSDTLSNPWPRPVSMLPRRLLDLSQGATVIIVDVAEWLSSGLCTAAELSDYCTLSYQWGTAPHACVLSDSFSILLEMSFSTMPQVFKDAITIARGLGIRFLWIDALCIVQPAASGDATDWRTEGPRMGIIYENSMFTIAATCANGTDDGILGKLGNSVHAAEPCRVVDLSHHESTADPDHVSSHGSSMNRQQSVVLDICTPSFFHSVSSSPLNARGWVMQERALSRRIIHFTEHGMFWECSQAKLHEHFGDVDPNSERAPCHTKETLLSVARARSSKHLCPVEWFHFVSQYSTAGFTDPQDRLIALSSVAKAAQPMLGGYAYYAGLWRNDLVRGLMWYCRAPSTDLRLRPTSLAPTWSWASVEGSINFIALGLETFAHELVEVLDVQTAPVVAENRFGNLSHGRLKLRGRPVKICLPTVNSAYKGWHDRLLVFWDEPQDTSKRYRDYVILPVGACKATGMSLERVLFGALVLELAETPTDERVYLHTNCAFRRIGWVEFVYRFDEVDQKLIGTYTTGSAYSWLSKAKESWWEECATTVTIV